MRTGYRFLDSIRSRLFFLLSITFLPILIIQATYFIDHFRSERSTELQANLEVARAMAEAFDQFVIDIVRQELAIGISLQQSVSVEQMNWILQRNCAEYPALRNLAWIDQQGLVIAASMQSVIGRDVKDRPYFQKILSGEDWTVTDLYVSQVTGEAIFSIARAVRDQAGSLLGIVLAAVLPDKLAEELSIERTRGGAITVIDKGARAVFRYPKMNWSWEERCIPKDKPEVIIAMSGQEYTGVYVCFRDGIDRILALAPIRSIGWAVAAGRPLDEVMAPIKFHVILQASFFFILTLAVFAISVIISRKIEAPIRALREHALSLARGDSANKIEARGPAEIKDLALAVESMARETKSREEALKKSEREKAAVLDGLREIVVYYIYPSARIVWANAAMEKTVGLSAEEMRGRHCYQIVHGLSEPCPECTALKAAATGVFQQGETKTPDGRAWVVGSSPIKDDTGKVTGVVHVATDITERKRAEEALRASEAKYRMLFEHSPLGIVHFDKSGSITACNENFARIFGSPKEKLTGLDLSACLEGEAAKAAFSDCMNGSIGHYEGYYRSLTCSDMKPLAINWGPVFSENGSVSGGMAIAEDISGRIRAQEALRESEAQLRFLSSRLLTEQEEARKRIASELHDSLGSSLSAVKMSLETVRNQIEQGIALPGSLDIPITWTQLAIDEARKMIANLRPSILDDLGIITTIGWFCKQFRTIHESIYVEEEIQVEENEVPEPIKIIIFRVVQEAFHNIAKHSKAELVSLYLEKNESGIELRIEDNGLGFDLEAALAARDQQRGIGLTSMKERTELSGGSFAIESIPGEGTTIRASWPL